jgi:hypothetical protein
MLQKLKRLWRMVSHASGSEILHQDAEVEGGEYVY